MFNNTIDSKELYTRPDGQVIRDLTQTTFELRSKKYIAYNVYKIPKEYAMRPDLISKAVYNSSDYAEIILKYNGISNPFSLAPGDLILIPDLESALQQLKKIGKGSKTNAAEQIRNSYKYLDTLKIPNKNKTIDDYNNRQLVDVNDGALPPNLAEAGETQITYRNGRAYFGECGCMESGLSTSEFYKNIIERR